MGQESARRSNRVRVLLDNNIWRYIADFGDFFELRNAARASLVDVQVAPAILEEVLRTVG